MGLTVTRCDRNAPRPELLDALTDVVRRERGKLVRQAQRQGASVEDAVECVQDALCTFLAMHRRGDAPEAPAAWGALLGAVVKNAARNKRRSASRAKARAHGARAPDELPRPDVPADDLVARGEETMRLRACVAELCERERAVVTLRLLDERPGEDVATALGLTRGHVDVLVHRAKAQLRACMQRAS